MNTYSYMDVEIAVNTLHLKGKERALVQARERSRNILRQVANDFLKLANGTDTPAATYLRGKAGEWHQLCDNTERDDSPASVWTFVDGTWSIEMSELTAVGFIDFEPSSGSKVVITPEGNYKLTLFDRDCDADGDVRCWLYENQVGVKFIIFND